MHSKVITLRFWWNTICKWWSCLEVIISYYCKTTIGATGMNEHVIELIDGKQPRYRLIYALSLVELETLKTYIETHLRTGFIWLSKSLVWAPILFDKKLDGSLCLCVDYQGLNNLTIKNWYPLLLIGEALDCLGRTKRFTKLDLTSVYHRMRIREGDKWKTAFRTW